MSAAEAGDAAAMKITKAEIDMDHSSSVLITVGYEQTLNRLVGPATCAAFHGPIRRSVVQHHSILRACGKCVSRAPVILSLDQIGKSSVPFSA